MRNVGIPCWVGLESIQPTVSVGVCPRTTELTLSFLRYRHRSHRSLLPRRSSNELGEQQSEKRLDYLDVGHRLRLWAQVRTLFVRVR